MGRKVIEQLDHEVELGKPEGEVLLVVLILLNVCIKRLRCISTMAMTA